MLTSSTKDVAAKVRSLMVHDRLDVDEALSRTFAESDEGRAGLPSSDFSEQVRGHLLGLGALQPFLEDPSVEELWINSPTDVFVARAGTSERVYVELTSEDVRSLVERILRPTGRRIDTSQPFVDASLPDGSRLHVVIPDITRSHWSVNIRKFSSTLRTLGHLVQAGALPAGLANDLESRVASGASVLVSGATQAGKTTLLTALLHALPSDERVITVEETFELRLDRSDHVALQCRVASLEGTGEVTLRRLVKEALRMRPDRLIVGEVRDAEALDLLIALNSGLPGMCSIHSKSAQGALDKLALLPLLAGRNIDARFVISAIANTIDLVIHVERSADGIRRVTSVIEPCGLGDHNTLVTRTIFALQCDDAPADGAP